MIGNLICWWRKHHIYGHKVKLSRVNGYTLPYKWGYVCSRCGNIKEGASPKRRGKQ